MAIKIGDTGSNSITGTSNVDFLAGDYGNDTFTPGEGFDLIDGWFGNDIVNVGSGDVHFEGGAGTDQVNVAASSDWVIAPSAYGSSLNFSSSLVNLKTGQTIGMSSVEKLKIGSVTYNFRSGSDGNSTLTGTEGRDFIRGMDGDDKITTGGGDDWVSGGSGSDTISTGSGADVVDESESYAEYGDKEHNDIDTGSNNDTIKIASSYYGNLTYNINGGTGSDIVYIGLGSGSFYAEKTGDVTSFGYYNDGFIEPNILGTLQNVEQIVDVYGNAAITLTKNGWVDGRNVVNGSTGTSLADDIFGSTASNTLTGGGGYDRFHGGAGTDTVVLDGRADMWYVQNASFGEDDYLTLSNGFDGRTPAVDIFSDVEKIKFTNGSGADTTYNFKMLEGVSLASRATESSDLLIVRGAETGDRLFLKGSDDIVDGVGDVAKVDGGSGDDRISWSGYTDKAEFLGGTGDDQISVYKYAFGPSGPSQSITVDGGDGNDRIYVGTTPSGDKVTVKGGAGSDQITAGHAATVDAGSGNDVVDAHFDHTSAVGNFNGGSGTDLFALGYSSDYIITKSGSDYLVTEKSSGSAIKITSFEGIKFSNMPIDVAKGFTTYNGSSSSVTKTGTSGIDLMHGGGGSDKLNGGSGNDSLAGDSGSDTLDGGAGNDFLAGGTGNDTLIGGTGSDMFFFNMAREELIGTDTIMDFKSNDVLAFDPVSDDLNSYTELLKLADQVGKDTVFTFDNGDKIILKGVDMDDLGQDSFYFFN